MHPVVVAPVTHAAPDGAARLVVRQLRSPMKSGIRKSNIGVGTFTPLPIPSFDALCTQTFSEWAKDLPPFVGPAAAHELYYIQKEQQRVYNKRQ